MVEMTIQNIVASAIIAEKLDLDYIAQSIEITEYEPEQFPGLIYRLSQPKTATLLFSSGKVNCTGAKSVEDVRKTLDIIVEQLQKIDIDVYDKKDIQIIIQNIVATANLNGELNLNEVAVGLGLENIEYEPEQFPGLIYRVEVPKVAMLLFSSGKIVCAGGRNVEEVSLAIEYLTKELTSLGLFL